MKKRLFGFGIGAFCLVACVVCFVSLGGQNRISNFFKMIQGDFSELDLSNLSSDSEVEWNQGGGLSSIWEPAVDYQAQESLAEHEQYYYGILDPEEQQVYGEIYAAMRDKSDYSKVSTTDDAMIGKMMEYVLLDNPELFYVETLQTQLTSVGGLSTMRVKATQNMTEAQQQEALGQIQLWAQKCLIQLTDNMSDYDKALYIYEYVVSNIEYVDGAPYNQSLYSAALGQSVCRGYASAFKYLCDQEKIPCIMVSGTMEGQSHSWNMVYLDGQWNHVDCTAGDDMREAGIDVDYSWFGLNDALVEASHMPSEPGAIPTSVSMNNDYYYRNSLYFSTCELNNISGKLAMGMDFSFRCGSYEVYEAYRDMLGTSSEVGAIIGNRYVQFVGNNNTYTIFIFFE